MDHIYVFGHKNPDTDTICAAIAYAHLKNTVQPVHIPARLGDINRETRFVLEHFGVPEPIFLPHVYVRAQDIMTPNPITAPAEATVYDVGELMHQHNIQAVPILNGSGLPRGVVTERSLARGYLNELHLPNLSATPTALGMIAQTLNAQIVAGDPTTLVSGNAVIAAMNIYTIVEYVSPGDLVIVGNRDNAQEASLGRNISCLVITGGIFPSDEIVAMAREKNAAIIVTPHDTFATARLIGLSVPALTLMEQNILSVSPEHLVNEITPDLLASRHGVALVNDQRGRLVGVLTKSDVAPSAVSPPTGLIALTFWKFWTTTALAGWKPLAPSWP
jgi:manganese-dependent inorganic pyrophosphatase